MIELDQFWNEAFIPAFKKCDIDIDAEDKSSLRLKDYSYYIDGYKSLISKKFNEKCDWLKQFFLPEYGKTEKLDFHKLAAVSCRCIIGNKPYKFNTHSAEKLLEKLKDNDELTKSQKLAREINSIYINYKFAYLVSIGIAYIDLLYRTKMRINEASNDLEKTVYTEIFEGIQKEHSLRCYPKSNCHDDFDSSVILSLMQSDISMRDFDYLLYSAMVYQYQEYAKARIVSEVLVKKNIPIDKIDSFL